MGIAEFWQRQRLIDSGKIRPRTLRPKKRKKGKYEIDALEIDKQSPDVQKKILDVMEIQLILLHTQSDLRDYMKSSEKFDNSDRKSRVAQFCERLQ